MHVVSLWKPRLPLVPPCFKLHESRLCRAETAALNTRLQPHVFERREPPTTTLHLFLKKGWETFTRLRTLAHNPKRRGQFLYRLFRVSTVVGRHQGQVPESFGELLLTPAKKNPPRLKLFPFRHGVVILSFMP